MKKGGLLISIFIKERRLGLPLLLGIKTSTSAPPTKTCTAPDLAPSLFQVRSLMPGEPRSVPTMARSPRASSRSQTLGAGACRLLFFCVAAVALTAHSAAATCSTASDCSTCMNSYGTTGEGVCRWCDSTEECVDVTTLEADDDDDDDGSGGSGSNSWSRNDDAGSRAFLRRRRGLLPALDSTVKN